ncbi:MULTISPECIES: tRNA (uridine(34)/cytosine(34)/5-carboxymethylaminomethyluridine(34)-2'-O)-methyltransferase TrmL [unclassified Methylophaga]|uniref:tRNA (cytidine(34)-2'-O)-methyltransferase n=3 Tax=Methylophaga TaxID=40222 RepID=A7LKV6_9GAMM|nr:MULTISPECIES: tRNA (uridine(34)/cytosine(34)/5-carboxymethylaminomethyluridine(34)-2'-O)-methyltransferase TrmL [unclassified Methylophaga]ABS82777.1 RNA methyltransferase [uncultured Methylophaga sp.]MAL48816.1 tRNA (uridine(34)/cytosine(34)/5-carboxymethylaminomethyluridine(34)-2'-O)-methyltransferase TrmL [Methylophaga sp.]MAP28147.1 tRNA (uridine(34)/cytosine(34)/5-carboxymethylaminomethyluridine(34)-2'-O)-methyltransferase TrmL [Methylophaga sp.]MBP26066.1 tRNA (uridine(34)/cytosine(34)
MLHIALYEPEIPPNTGNIIRLCANTGAQLHLIEPLAFVLDDKRLRRAGLDYHEFAPVKVHADFAAFQQWQQNRPLFACTTKAKQFHHQATFIDESILLFGPESRGLPATLLDNLPDRQKIRIPMYPESRSLNLSNATAIILYEAWRQLDYNGAV